MRVFRSLTVAAALLASREALAQTATQVVRIQVNAINQIGVSGDPAPLVITTAVAGQAPTSVVATGTSYSITTNESNKKITAALDQPLPAGVALAVALVAPPGAQSAGEVMLATSSADVVTGVSALSSTGLAITYRLSADATVRMPVPAARTITFTIVSGP